MFKNYAFVNGNNIVTNSYGAPYQSNILENFSLNNRIIEHAVIGGDNQTTQNETSIH